MNDDPNGNAPEPAGPQAAETADLASLPFPIAYPLAHARDCALSPRDRLDNAIFAVYQAMRLTALLLLADYLACDVTSRRLAAPIRGLRMPHWGEWTLLADQLAKLWRGDFPDEPSTGPSHFTALVDGWMDVNRGGAPKRGDDPWRALLEGLPGTQGRARSANDAVQKLRNHRAHRMATRIADQSDDERLLGRILPVVERSAACLFPAGSLVLVRSVEKTDQGLRVLRLHGPHADFLFALEPLAAEWAGVFEATGVAALTGDVGIPVYPLFVPGDEEPEACRVGSGGLIEPVSLVDGLNEKRLVLLGVRSHGESEKHLAPLLEALRRKQVDPGQDREETKRGTLAGWSRATARETVTALRGRKYFPECYVERRRVDEPVSSCLERAGRALLVLGEAGAGKSSLLARLADRLSAESTDDDASTDDTRRDEKLEHAILERYLAEKGDGDVVLFLSGHAAFAGDAGKDGAALLCDAVLQRAGVRAGAFRDLAELMARLAETAKDDTQEGRRVWLLLDALNEAERFSDLLKALDAFLPDVEKHPWLRVVVSMRSGAYHALAARKLTNAGHGGAVFSNERYLHTFHDGRLDRVLPYLELPPFDETDEGPRAYALRQTALPDRSSAIPYERLTPSLRRLLLSPLRLHVFHETFRDESEAPPAIDEGLLLDAYLEQLNAELPALRQTLADVGRLMYDRRAPMLPLDVADEWLTGWRARQGYDSAARVVKLDPIEELVAASVLMRPSEEGIGTNRRLVGYQFSHQKLCERVLLRELLRQIAPRELPTGQEVLAWAQRAAGLEQEEHDDFAELIGALEVIAGRLAEAGEAEVLAALLALKDEPARTRILGAAIRALGPTWGTSANGEPKPAAVVRAFVERGACAADGQRFVASARQGRDWLARSGFSLAAQALDHASVDILHLLLEAEPQRGDLQCDLSAWLNQLGNLARVAGRRREAYHHFDRSVRILRRLLEAEPDCSDFSRELASSLNALGHLARPLLSEEDYRELPKSPHPSYIDFADGFRSSLEESVEILRRLLIAEPQRVDLQRDLAVFLGDLGTLARIDRRPETAASCFQESLEILRRLVGAEPLRVDFRRDLAVALSYLGRLTRRDGRSDDARAYFGESVEILGRLVALEPQRTDLRHELAVSVSYLGRLARDAGRSDEALAFLGESAEILRRLVAAESHRADFQTELAACLGRLGTLAETTGRAEEARALFGENLQVVRRLAAAEPRNESLLSDLASVLDHLGNWELAAGRLGEARSLFEEHVGVMRRLAAADPEDFRELWRIKYWEGGVVAAKPKRSESLRSLAASLAILGRLQRDDGHSDEARTLFVEELEVMRRLVAAEPERAQLRRDLADSLRRLGRLARDGGHLDEARTLFQEELSVIRRLVAVEPERADLQYDLAISLGRSGSLAHSAGRIDDARTLFHEELDVIRRLVAVEPERTDVQQELAVVLGNIGHLAHSAGRIDDARTLFHEELDVIRRLLAAEPERADLRYDLAGCLQRLGRLSGAAHRSDEARAFFQESLGVMRGLVAGEPDHVDFQRALAILLNDLGRLARADGDGELARPLFEESLQLVRRLVASEPERADLQRDLAVCLGHIGQFMRAAARIDAARAFFEEMVDVRRRLLTTEPEHAERRIDLASSLAYLFQLATDRDEEVRYLHLVLEALQPLRDAGHEDQRVTKLWDRASEALAARAGPTD
ncbi:MAG: tetratricopeptide repeat protein [Deltaproteobacteria bacterium]|nr:tetratricopeptide repeat protein [Deltaproteobacteria bacterium]